MKSGGSECRTNTQDRLGQKMNVVLKRKGESSSRCARLGLVLLGLMKKIFFLNGRAQTPPWGAVQPWREPATMACDANTHMPWCKVKTRAHVLIDEKAVRTLGRRQPTLTDEQVSGMPTHPWCPNTSAHTHWCMVVQCCADAMTHKHLRLVLIAMARSLTHTWIMCHGILEWKSVAFTRIKCGWHEGHVSQPFRFHFFSFDMLCLYCRALENTLRKFDFFF